MSLKVLVHKHILDFRFTAGTSRGSLTQHTAYYLSVTDDEKPGVTGIGEASPLKGLSPEYPDFEAHLHRICDEFNSYELEVFPWNLNLILDQCFDPGFPSVRFAFETALHDLLNGGTRHVFPNDFSRGKRLPINGLVWMGSREEMLAQIRQKLDAGFTTIKMKVGAIDFQQELDCLEYVRKRYSPDDITLRVDANGAWTPEEARQKLEALAALELHSVEQPIRAGQPEAMHDLCRTSPVPIALDEELIGVYDYVDKMKLVKAIQPAYLILKPTLLGGFQQCGEWIEIAGRNHVGWWVTSALESNIGLNAICQFTAGFPVTLPQGLGTGSLYHNNIPSPLTVENGTIFTDPATPWDLSLTRQAGDPAHSSPVSDFLLPGKADSDI